jgi:vacuolar protein sorting-associated protein 26
MPIYSGNDNITGNVDVKMDKCKKFEHLGIKLELIG